MSHYKPYPEYKDSGVEWIGAVPEHWGVSPFFTVAKELSRSNKGMIESKVLSLSYGRIIKKPKSDNLGLVPESYETYQIVEPGEIVFRLTDLQNDKNSLRSAQVMELGIITSAYLAARAFNIDKTYLAWLMRAYDHCKVFYTLGGGLRQSLKYSDIKRLPVLLPPLVEQSLSVNLIDRETTRIDSLIAKKTRFVELLKEKRQSMITHAVTKGLDPNVKMKESGVEWIGEVPEHWSVLRLSNIGQISKACGGNKQDDSESGTPCIRYGDLYTTYDIIIRDIKKYITQESESNYTPIKYGDILFAASGETFEEIGKSSVNLSSIHACCGGDLIILRPFGNTDPVYAAYAVGSTSAQAQKSQMGKGFTVIHIYGNQIKNILIAAPDLNEQKNIGQYLERRSKIFDILIEKTQRSIDIIKERRSALITAAVTGKIDLR